jgi:Flp pilus assembly pilin Flp
MGILNRPAGYRPDRIYRLQRNNTERCKYFVTVAVCQWGPLDRHRAAILPGDRISAYTIQGSAVVTPICDEIHRLTADSCGVTALEYAMIASVIATSIVSIVTSLGFDLTLVIGNVVSSF